jgi:hypothetical protein
MGFVQNMLLSLTKLRRLARHYISLRAESMMGHTPGKMSIYINRTGRSSLVKSRLKSCVVGYPTGTRTISPVPSVQSSNRVSRCPMKWRTLGPDPRPPAGGSCAPHLLLKNKKIDHDDSPPSPFSTVVVGYKKSCLDYHFLCHDSFQDLLGEGSVREKKHASELTRNLLDDRQCEAQFGLGSSSNSSRLVITTLFSHATASFRPQRLLRRVYGSRNGLSSCPCRVLSRISEFC